MPKVEVINWLTSNQQSIGKTVAGLFYNSEGEVAFAFTDGCGLCLLSQIVNMSLDFENDEELHNAMLIVGDSVEMINKEIATVIESSRMVLFSAISPERINPATENHKSFYSNANLVVCATDGNFESSHSVSLASGYSPQDADNPDMADFWTW